MTPEKAADIVAALAAFGIKAALHITMCALFTGALAIPTGWETALFAGPTLYVVIVFIAPQPNGPTKDVQP